MDLREGAAVRFLEPKGGYPAGTVGRLVEVYPDGAFVEPDKPKADLPQPFVRWEEVEKV